MAYVSLYRKYRSQTFSEILGQEHVTTTLANAITEGRVAHAYLFTGPRGTGKTSTARVLAKALNCEKGPTPEPCGKCEACVAIAEGSSLDVFELDAASHSGVDETREILAGVPLATAGGRKKIYVIDEVHMLTTQSFNALLKTLEEPPDHVVFVLATTEAHKVLPTIVSRTQRFDFRRIPADVLAAHLEHVAKVEQIDIEPDAIGTIARHADGSARDALSALDQLASLGATITARDADRLLGERGEDAYFRLYDAIGEGDVGSVFTTLDAMVTQGADVRQLALGALHHARSLLLLKTAPGAEELVDAADEDRGRLAEQAARMRIGGLLRTLDLIGKAITEMRNAPNHRLFLEVALARAASPEADPSPDAVLGRIERLERRLGIEAESGMGGPAAEAVAPVSPAETAPPVEAGAGGDKDQGEASPDLPAEQVRAEPDVAEGPPAKPAQASSPDHVGLSHIRDAWEATLREVARRSKRVGAYLNPSRPTDYDADELVVEVQSAFHSASMAREDNSDVLSDSLHAALGIRPTLRFVERGGPAGAATSPAAAAPSSEPARSQQQSGAGASKPETSSRGDGPDREAEGGGEGLGDYADAADADGQPDPVELVKRGLGAEVVREEGGDR